jgi:hypothetical protein
MPKINKSPRIVLRAGYVWVENPRQERNRRYLGVVRRNLDMKEEGKRVIPGNLGRSVASLGVLLLFLLFGSFDLRIQQLTMVFDAAVDGFNRISQQKAVGFLLCRTHPGGIL